MKFNKKYDYKQFSKEDIPLDNFQKEILIKILCEDSFETFLTDYDKNYLILLDNKLIGFFSLNITDRIMEVTCLYILEEYRMQYIATEVINDILFASRHNVHGEIRYIVANSFVDSALFFFKKGFDFCKINSEVNFKKRNVVKMYKKI